MDLREQVLQMRQLLEENSLCIDDFELNVDSDAFKQLMAGGGGSLELHCKTSGVAIEYSYDGSAAWLDLLAADLGRGAFAVKG